ncbi:MAG TPA: M28 family peptidase [Sphingomicrobium sp.]|jgi:hypothetical protein
MRRTSLLTIALLALILGAMAAKSWLVQVPPVRAHTAAGQFDAARAKARLARVLGDQRPHPADSEASDAMRGRLVAELRALGLQPLVRDQYACNDFQKARLVACARVRNVIAVMGPAPGKALLLNAHYDSVPVGPGAGDDGIGVATLLEVAANLGTRQLTRPVILLFNEGEELGLLGARAFQADPLSRQVDSVLNFEARGVTGPAVMFETSQPNGTAVAAFARAAERPFASSLMTDAYRQMPNDTDVSVFRERGWTALNFALIGNETRYHSPSDDLAALDLGSVQHMGDQALALSQELAGGVPQAGGQRIFVDVLGRALIVTPLSAGLVLFITLVAAFAVLTFRWKAYGQALAAVALGFVGAGLFGWLAALLVGSIRGGTYWRAHPDVAFLSVYAAGLLAITIATATLGRCAETRQLRAAFWTLFLVIGGALALFAPGVLIYFLAPPSALLLGIAMSRWWRGAETAGALVALALLYLSWGEMLALLEQLFSPGPLWIVAPVGALLMLAAVVELHPLIRASSRAAVGGGAMLAALAIGGALAAPTYSADRKQRFTIEHVTDFRSGKSRWSLATDGAALPESYDQLGKWSWEKLDFGPRKRWVADAPRVAGMKPPSLEIIEKLSHGSARTLRLRLRTNGAERVAIIAPAEARIRSAGLAGYERPLRASDSPGEFTIACSGRSCDGAELIVEQPSAKPVTWTIVGMRNGLPSSAKPLVEARPRLAGPQYAPDQTIAVASTKP